MASDNDRKTNGVFKGLLETGSGVVGKAMDKGSDVASAMMTHTAGLISKISDDIGAMADRILMMEERIGLMADRIIKTEELMAKLTATLANRNLDLSSSESMTEQALRPPLLSVSTTETARSLPPQIQITGNPNLYLLYVSASPALRDTDTVVSKIETSGDLQTAWKRSLTALAGTFEPSDQASPHGAVLTVAVRSVGENGQPSPLSNSVDVLVAEG
ncbi:hypothetical protein [Halochromatium sp.]